MSDLKTQLLKLVDQHQLPGLLDLATKEERYEDAALIRDEMKARPTRRKSVAMRACKHCGRVGCRTLHKVDNPR